MGKGHKSKRTFEKSHKKSTNRDRGIVAKKHLGQHFLGDEEVTVIIKENN